MKERDVLLEKEKSNQKSREKVKESQRALTYASLNPNI